MNDTPRTDAALLTHFDEPVVPANFARHLERELRECKEQLRLAEMAASDNADWFDALVKDVAVIIGCERKPSTIIEGIKRVTEQRDAALTGYWAKVEGKL